MQGDVISNATRILGNASYGASRHQCRQAVMITDTLRMTPLRRRVVSFGNRWTLGGANVRSWHTRNAAAITRSKTLEHLLGWAASHAEIAHCSLLIMSLLRPPLQRVDNPSSRDLGWISQKAVAPFSIAPLAREPAAARFNCRCSTARLVTARR